MNDFVISYDLSKPDQNYPRVYDAIKEVANGYAHPLKSVWLIRSSYSKEQIRDALVAATDANDKVLVIQLTRNAAWHNLDKEQADWILQQYV